MSKEDDLIAADRDNKPGTLGYHRAMSAVVFGEDSPATKFLDEKIAKAAHGKDEKVICHESQLILILFSLHMHGTKPPASGIV